MAFEVVRLKDALHSKVMGDIEDILYEAKPWITMPSWGVMMCSTPQFPHVALQGTTSGPNGLSWCALKWSLEALQLGEVRSEQLSDK